MAKKTSRFVRDKNGNPSRCSHDVKPDTRGDDRQNLVKRHGRQVIPGPAQRLPRHHDQHQAARQA